MRMATGGLRSREGSSLNAYSPSHEAGILGHRSAVANGRPHVGSSPCGDEPRAAAYAGALGSVTADQQWGNRPRTVSRASVANVPGRKCNARSPSTVPEAE